MFEVQLFNDTEGKGDKNFVADRLNTLKKIIESLVGNVDQLEIKATDTGMAIQAMDQMHVALIDIFLSSSLFSSYRCDRDVQMGLSIQHFLAILKGLMVEESSVVKLSCEDSPQALRIEHITETSKYVSDIVLYQISSENYSIPPIEYHCTVKLSTEQFRNIMKSIGSFGEYISLNCGKDSVTFQQIGDLIKNNMKLDANKGSITVDSTEDAKVEIAMKYILSIIKVSYLSTEIVINMGTAMPVFFEIKIYDVLGYIRFYVAPKIDN